MRKSALCADQHPCVSSDHITKRMFSDVFQTTSACGLSYRKTMHLDPAHAFHCFSPVCVLWVWLWTEQ